MVNDKEKYYSDKMAEFAAEAQRGLMNMRYYHLNLIKHSGDRFGNKETAKKHVTAQYDNMIKIIDTFVNNYTK